MADPINTFFCDHRYQLISFNAGTGDYVLDKISSFPWAIGDDSGDSDLANGTAGNGIEIAGEALRVDGVPSIGGGSGIYTGWMIEGSPIVQIGGDYYVFTDSEGISIFGTAAAGNFAYCFRPGTQITTPTGERAIESLQIGDVVITASGAQKTVKWAARMTVPVTRFNRQSVLPICIKQGALGNGLPHRDLFVSNDHAFAIDGLLVIAGVLVNGATIVRCKDFVGDVIEYFHVEVEDHDLLLAEGAAAETLCDSNRARFDNVAEFHALYPDAVPGKLLAMARVTQARQLPKALRSKFFTKVA